MHWQDVDGWTGYYQVSDTGLVRSLDRIITTKRGHQRVMRGRLLNPETLKYGHQQVTLCRPGYTQRSRVHQLVARAFIGPTPPGLEVRHKNGNASDNRVENLEYGTRADNMRDRTAHGTQYQSTLTECKRGHALRAPNLIVTQAKKVERRCRACCRVRASIPITHPLFDQRADAAYKEIMTS